MSGDPAARGTIFALSSGAPPAAIGVVRISGPAAGPALRDLMGTLPPERRAVRRTLRDRDATPIDDAMVLWLPGPGTATGEDVAELHLHGGRAVIGAALAALGAMPALRMAEPGEFTRRALFNGRIDLAEAEGLADLLSAETELQRRQALRLVEGGLGRKVAEWRDVALTFAAGVESAIEFGEEDGGAVDVASLDTAAVAALVVEMESLLKAPPAERLRDGVRVLLAGPVNSGKSTLFNSLVGRDAAIASPMEGTTRDLIEVPVVIDGIPFLFMDSAGLRLSDEAVEREGMSRTRRAIDDADILLWLGDPAECPRGDHVINVHARHDLPERATVPIAADIAVSATRMIGLADLRIMIMQRARRLLPPPDTISLNLRQRACVVAAIEGLTLACEAREPVVEAEMLRQALLALDRIVGGAGVEDMLDALFSRFCLGK